MWLTSSVVMPLFLCVVADRLLGMHVHRHELLVMDRTNDLLPLGKTRWEVPGEGPVHLMSSAMPLLLFAVDHMPRSRDHPRELFECRGCLPEALGGLSLEFPGACGIQGYVLSVAIVLCLFAVGQLPCMHVCQHGVLVGALMLNRIVQLFFVVVDCSPCFLD